MSDTPPVETVESGTDDSRNNNADPNVNPIPESIGTTVDHGDSYNVESAWEGATHFVRFSHVSEEKSDDVVVPLYDTLSRQREAIKNIPGDGSIQVKVIDSNVGQSWAESKVLLESDEKEYYVNSVYLFPVNGISNLAFYSPEDADLFVDSSRETKIKDAKEAEPYDEKNHYNIVLDAGTLSKEEYGANLADLKRKAICQLIEHYGKKKLSSADIDSLIENPFGLIQSSEPYFPLRPGQNIKTKITIAKKYLNQLENKTFDDFAIENIHKDFIAVSIKASDITKDINKLIKILEKYDKQISGFAGHIEGLDMKVIISKLRSFISEFNKFLKLNGTTLDSSGDTKFELGFDKSTYKLNYVMQFTPYGTFLPIGIGLLACKFDAKVGKLLVRLKDVFSASAGGTAWMGFCTDFFAGDIKINFKMPSEIFDTAKIPFSKLEMNMDNLKADFSELKFMTPDDAASLVSMTNSSQFRVTASELLLRSRDFIGDQFLVDLPNILTNVDDLPSLYGLVFDKVSVKDLLDLVMEQAATELNLPDINEIKLRGILQALDFEIVLDILFDRLPTVDLELILASICDSTTMTAQMFDQLTSSLTSIPMVDLYMIHFKDDGTLGGLLADHYDGDLLSALSERNLNSCETLGVAIATGTFDIKDYYQESTYRKMLCQLLTDGLPEYQNPCPELTEVIENVLGIGASPLITIPGGLKLPSVSFSGIKINILNFLKGLDKSMVMPSIDLHMKDLFKTGANAMSLELSGELPPAGVLTPDELFAKFSEIPEIKLQLDKISLTKGKLTGKIPGLPLDFEMKKIDADFTLPSIKDCNPSFDFGKFQFSGMQDIFSGAIGGIESALIQGIEAGLVGAFKVILEGVLDSVNMNPPNIDAPDFGGLSLPDLMDASDGFSAEAFEMIVTDVLCSAVGKFDIKFFEECNVCEELQDLAGYCPEEEDTKKALEDMSSAVKPLELTRMLKGQRNKKDFENMRAAITDPKIKQVLTEDVFGEIIDIANDFVDIAMLEELEDAYDNKAVMINVCNDRGIPYGVRDIRQNLIDKYDDLTQEEISDLIDNIVDETKDSLVDAIANGAKGALGGNFEDNLPFNEDPCSFMPKQSDIPALNFVNNMVFDAIFDPIEIEYKAEATAFPDTLMSPETEEEYVKLYYDRFDYILDEEQPYIQDAATGEYQLNLKQVGEDDKYNQDFGNHYKGEQTPIYIEDGYGGYKEISKPFDDYGLAKDDTDSWGADSQLYVKSTDQKMKPIKGLKDFYNFPLATLRNESDGNVVDGEVVQEEEYHIKFQINRSDPAAPPEFGGDPEVKIIFGDSYNKLKFSAMGNSAQATCLNDENLQASLPQNPGTFVNRLKKSVENTTKRIVDEDEYISSNIERNITSNLVGISYYTNSSAPVGFPHTGVIAKSMASYIMHGFLDVLYDRLAETSLFETSYLQTFLFETEDIKLFRVQEAKNDAKEEFNENCSFKEDGSENPISSSSIKKLIYLTFRIYLIEIMARSCFVFDSIYQKSMNQFLCSMLHRTMTNELSTYSKGYFQVFKEKYNEAYGAPFPETPPESENDTFYKLASEIWDDMSQTFPALFQNAQVNDGLIGLFMEEVPIYKGTYANFPHYCATAFVNNKPFVIQKIERVLYNTGDDQSDGSFGITNKKEFIYGREKYKKDGGIRSHSAIEGSESEYLYRLCYIKRKDGEYKDVAKLKSGENDTVGNFCDEIADIHDSRIPTHVSSWISERIDTDNLSEYSVDVSEATRTGYVLEGTGSDIVKDQRQLGFYRYKLIRQAPILQTKVEYSWKRTGSSASEQTEAEFFIVPLAETEIPVDADGELDMGGLSEIDFLLQPAPDGASSLSIHSFLKYTIQLESLMNGILAANNLKILKEKPSSRNAFTNTKLTIKRAIESLSQDDDNFTFEDQETKNIALEQSQGQSTEPEFSAKAAKMALMTIPMIIKGAAEMFDPNIKISKGIRLGADLAGFNIPPPVASLMGLPLNLIPFAPGPPITPLGLAYLATSFLEPKERKKLSDLRRGKNLNPGADPGGGFIEGTMEEQAEAARELALDDIRGTIVKHYTIKRTIYEFYEQMNDLIDSTLQAIQQEEFYDDYFRSVNGDMHGNNITQHHKLSHATALPCLRQSYDNGGAFPVFNTFGSGYSIFEASPSNSSVLISDGHATTEVFSVNSAGFGVTLIPAYRFYLEGARIRNFRIYGRDYDINAESWEKVPIYKSTNDEQESLFAYLKHVCKLLFPKTGFGFNRLDEGSHSVPNADNLYYGKTGPSNGWKHVNGLSNVATENNMWGNHVARDYDFGEHFSQQGFFVGADNRRFIFHGERVGYKIQERTYIEQAGEDGVYTILDYTGNPHCADNTLYDFHSAYLNYLSKLSDNHEDIHPNRFLSSEKFHGARNVLFHMEVFEAAATAMVGTVLEQINHTMFGSMKDEDTQALQDKFQTARTTHTKSGTVIVPGTNPFEVVSYEYPDLAQVKADAMSSWIYEYGLAINPAASDSGYETFIRRYSAQNSTVKPPPPGEAGERQQMLAVGAPAALGTLTMDPPAASSSPTTVTASRALSHPGSVWNDRKEIENALKQGFDILYGSVFKELVKELSEAAESLD